MNPALLEVLFSPTEFAALLQTDLSRTVCVVFDVLRATSSMVTALANGARAIAPASDIPEALNLHDRLEGSLLAGERGGLRITAEMAGVDFDLGNSPREFTRERVADRTIVMTTTNGTRALRACAHAAEVLIGSCLNRQAVAQWLHQERPEKLLLVCGGTYEEAAYEDVLAAGAVVDAACDLFPQGPIADSALMARQLFQSCRGDLAAAFQRSRNGGRLARIPELCDDVPFCARLDPVHVLGFMHEDGCIRAGSLPR